MPSQTSCFGATWDSEAGAVSSRGSRTHARQPDWVSAKACAKHRSQSHGPLPAYLIFKLPSVTGTFLLHALHSLQAKVVAMRKMPKDALSSPKAPKMEAPPR